MYAMEKYTFILHRIHDRIKLVYDARQQDCSNSLDRHNHHMNVLLIQELCTS
jgi:hypothetical protein